MSDDGREEHQVLASALLEDLAAKESEPRVRGMSLRSVRKELGRTQVEVARQAGMSQGDLSRLERRHDHLLSTLERYAEALGGRLDITLVREGRRYPLDFQGRY